MTWKHRFFKARAELHIGRNEGFPACCVIRYALEHFQRDAMGFEHRSWRRSPLNNYGFVPCGVFHRSENPVRSAYTWRLRPDVAPNVVEVVKKEETAT